MLPSTGGLGRAGGSRGSGGDALARLASQHAAVGGACGAAYALPSLRVGDAEDTGVPWQAGAAANTVFLHAK